MRDSRLFVLLTFIVGIIGLDCANETKFIFFYGFAAFFSYFQKVGPGIWRPFFDRKFRATRDVGNEKSGNEARTRMVKTAIPKPKTIGESDDLESLF